MVLGPGPLMVKMGTNICWSDGPVHHLPAVYNELAKLVMSNLERLEEKVEMAIARPNRNMGGARDWRDRRGGQLSR